jgi:hypothetical protein
LGGGDYLAGRDLLLGRLRAFRAGKDAETVRPIAQAIYRSLIAFGEEAWDMRFVHLTVECRDVLLYGL